MFKVGDLVEWTSQSAGVTKAKRGEVVEVISRGNVPKLHGVRHYSWRDHESYVVKANGRRYWPRVAHLKAAVPLVGIGDASGAQIIDVMQALKDSIARGGGR
jgi:hypothetical protein